jgi:DNA-binding IclR family transcriptional regulator
LSDHGLLEREKRDLGYVAGPRTLALSDLYLARHSLFEDVELALEDLVKEFGFVGYVTMLQGPNIVILRVKHGSYPLRMVQEVGKQIPAFRTAVGRALLAREADETALRLVAESKEVELEKEQILAELNAVRHAGLATTVSTVIPGIAAIAAAVQDPKRGDSLGFSISYPIGATDQALRTRMAERIHHEARAIGMRRGDPYWLSKTSNVPTGDKPQPTRHLRTSAGAQPAP